MKEQLRRLLLKYNELLKVGVSTRDQEHKDTIEEISKIVSENPEYMEDFTEEAAAISESIHSNPKYSNFQTMQELTGSIEGAVDLFNTFSNIATAKRQIEDARTAAEEIQKPETPSLTPKSAELKEATLDARLASRGRIREIDPILQRNLDLMRSGLNVAKTASAGQAGIYGSLGQAAINQAQRANMAAIPEIERVKRSRDARYDSLLRTGISEDFSRGAERMGLYDRQYQQYTDEARAIGELGSVGNYNLAMQRQDLGGVLGSTFSNISGGVLNNMRFRRGRNQDSVGQQYTQNNPTGGVQYGNIGSSLLPQVNYTSLSNINSKYTGLNNRIDINLAGYFKNK
jgi:hypothetical protein